MLCKRREILLRWGSDPDCSPPVLRVGYGRVSVRLGRRLSRGPLGRERAVGRGALNLNLRSPNPSVEVTYTSTTAPGETLTEAATAVKFCRVRRDGVSDEPARGCPLATPWRRRGGTGWSSGAPTARRRAPSPSRPSAQRPTPSAKPPRRTTSGGGRGDLPGTRKRGGAGSGGRARGPHVACPRLEFYSLDRYSPH